MLSLDDRVAIGNDRYASKLNNVSYTCDICHEVRPTESAITAHLRAIHGYSHQHAHDLVSAWKGN